MARKSRKNVGLIGLGLIGSRVAAGLRSAGFHVFVWSRTPHPEPNFLGSAAEIAEACDTIQLFVPDAQALFETIEGFGDSLTPKHTILCCATVGPEATLEAARLVHDKGARFLDAPFTGSKLAAERGELVYYIGGDERVLDRVEPVLSASARAIVRVGEIGQAATIKVATNMMAAVTMQTLAEAYTVVTRSGIDPEVFAAALEQHGVRSALVDMKLPKIIHSDFDPHFALKHMFKDVQLAIHLANSLEIDIPATTATAGVMYGGLNRGWSDLDFSVLAKVYAPRDERAPAALGDAASEAEKSAGSQSSESGNHPAKRETRSESATPSLVPDEQLAVPALHAAAGAGGAPSAVTPGESEKGVHPPKETLSNMTPPPRPESGGSAAPPLHLRPAATSVTEKGSTAPPAEGTRTNTAASSGNNPAPPIQAASIPSIPQTKQHDPGPNGIESPRAVEKPGESRGGSNAPTGSVTTATSSIGDPGLGGSAKRDEPVGEDEPKKEPSNPLNRLRRFFASKVPE